jgi:hypothetical protein
MCGIRFVHKLNHTTGLFGRDQRRAHSVLDHVHEQAARGSEPYTPMRVSRQPEERIGEQCRLVVDEGWARRRGRERAGAIKYS